MCHVGVRFAGALVDSYSGERYSGLFALGLARAFLSVRSSVDDLVVGSALFKEHTVRAVPCISPLTGLR